MNLISHDIKIGQRRVVVSICQSGPSSPTLIIGPAMGVKSSFYHPIAEYFYDRDFNCVLVDYHGMFFESNNPSPSDIASFGKIDLMHVIQYCRDELRAKDLFFLGHSISGQILPLAENANEFSAAYLVASQSVDRTNWSGRSRLAVDFFWNVLIPLSTAIFHYLPAWTYGGKRHLAKSVARDWARLAKTSGGLAEDNAYNGSRYKAYNVPTKFVSIDGDDLLAPKKAVSDLYQRYGSTAKTIRHVGSDSTSRGSIDHFNFFRTHNSELWSDIHHWFNSAALIDYDVPDETSRKTSLGFFHSSSEKSI